jgi:hypothetical protein
LPVLFPDTFFLAAGLVVERPPTAKELFAPGALPLEGILALPFNVAAGA